MSEPDSGPGCGAHPESPVGCEHTAFATAIFHLAAGENLHSAGHLLDHYRRTRPPGDNNDWVGYMVQDWIDMYADHIGLGEDALDQLPNTATFTFTLRSAESSETYNVDTARRTSVWAARLMTARIARDEQAFLALWAYLDTLDATGRGWHIMEILRMLGATIAAYEEGLVEKPLEIVYEPHPQGGGWDTEP